ncbi:MAG: NADH-quinone oxidoreductase subunit C [Negativicutes bacterium]|nr:NADH-quinone oxidoreductase subunit C [Negativicutes bacterium]
MSENLFAKLTEHQLSDLAGLGCQLDGEGACLLTVPAERLLAVMKMLRDDVASSMNYLGDITAVDRGEAGFEIIYQLFSVTRGVKATVKVKVPKDKPEVPSVVSLWPGADWMEREAYDLMGVTFAGHPELKRILLDEDFAGHPLRKDFRMQPRE